MEGGVVCTEIAVKLNQNLSVYLFRQPSYHETRYDLQEDAISRMPGTRANPEPAATAPAPSASTPPLPQPPSPDSFVPTPIRPTARVVPTTLPLTDLKLAQSVDLTEGEAGRAVVAATGASSTVKVPFVEVLQGKGTDAAEEVRCILMLVFAVRFFYLSSVCCFFSVQHVFHIFRHWRRCV